MEQLFIVKQLLDLYFLNRTEYHYMYPVAADDGTQTGEYCASPYPLDETDIFEHLDGKKTVCVCGSEYHTIFMTFDVDEGDKDHLRALLARLAEVGIPPELTYVSTSGGKGYHVDIFFDTLIFKSDIEHFFWYVRRDPVVAEIHMECRPIHGRSIKVPLGVNFRTGRRCWYLDRDTLDPIESFEYALEIKKMSGALFQALVHKCNINRRTEDYAVAKQNSERMKNMPKAERKRAFKSKKEPMMTAPGQRHDMMLKKAVYLRMIGAEIEEIYDELLAWVDRQIPGLIRSTRKEIEDDAKQIAKDVARRYHPKADSYHQPKEPWSEAHAVFTEEDIQAILPIKNKSARRVAALLMAHLKVFKMCRISFDRIDDVVGVSNVTSQTAVRTLIERGIIKKTKRGGLSYNQKVPVLVPNEYTLADNPQRDRTIKVLCNTEFKIPTTLDEFERFYYGMLARMCDKKTLQKYLSRSEIKILEGIQSG